MKLAKMCFKFQKTALSWFNMWRAETNSITCHWNKRTTHQEERKTWFLWKPVKYLFMWAKNNFINQVSALIISFSDDLSPSVDLMSHISGRICVSLVLCNFICRYYPYQISTKPEQRSPVKIVCLLCKHSLPDLSSGKRGDYHSVFWSDWILFCFGRMSQGRLPGGNDI